MSRPILYRCKVILDELLREQRQDDARQLPVNCRALAEKLEVSPRTIARDVEFMRDSLAVPLDYDASLHSFFLTRAMLPEAGSIIQKGRR